MKVSQRDTERLLIWEDMRNTRALPKLMGWLILFVVATYVIYTLKLVINSHSCDDEIFPTISHKSLSIHRLDSDNFTLLPENQEVQRKTEVKDIVFGIAASAKLWEKRKNYIKLWWKPENTRGIAWLDNPVKGKKDSGLPPVKISANTSQFAYKNRQGHRSAIRISRIVSETLRLGM